MAGPTPESSYDAVRYVTNRIRVVWGLLAALAVPIGWGAAHIYDLGVLVEKNRSHEETQDAEVADLELRLKISGLTRDSDDQRANERAGMVFGQLDAIREILVELVPKRSRAKLRDEFRAQRKRERDLLLGTGN